MRSDTPPAIRVVLGAAGWFLGIFLLDVAAHRMPVSLWSAAFVALAAAVLCPAVAYLLGHGPERRLAVVGTAATVVVAAWYALIIAVVRGHRLDQGFPYWPLAHALASVILLAAVARAGRPRVGAVFPIAVTTAVLAWEAIIRLSGRVQPPPVSTGYVWLFGVLVGSAVGAGLVIWLMLAGAPRTPGAHPDVAV